MKKAIDWIIETPERRIVCALMMLCAMIYIPLAGNYGMWDPWETHYGEVARQMLERNDFVSQWWPGSPQDRAEFWSKPVLTFWLMAIGMKVAGIQWNPASPGEIADSWRVEWGARMPLIILSIVAIWSVWELVRRLAGRRAATIAAVVLATSSQWALITRQAMTDMAFVAPMTIALALAGLALLLPEEERERELPRKRLMRLGRREISYPAARPFYVFAALFVLTVLPQLVIISVQVSAVLRLGTMNIRLWGILCMLPWIAVFFAALLWCMRARNTRQLYLFAAYVLCGLASLAKGPAGVALPAIVLAIYLVLTGRWKDLIFKAEIPRGVLLFLATAAPWYHGMLIRHGTGFWREFIGDNYVNRAGGRHGDRGTFEYYIQWGAYAMFPWSGIAALSGLWGLKKLRDGSPRKHLVAFALVWFLVEFSTMSLVNTKFHHYILPALPALAILAGLMLDELLRRPDRLLVGGLFLVALPVTFLSGRDLASFPPRLLWLFNYDYVNMPGTGRPWPLPSLYGDRYEYGTQIWVFAIVATLAVLGLAIWAARSRKAAESEPIDADEPAPTGGMQPNQAIALAAAFVLLLVAAILTGPASPRGAAPTIARAAWLMPAALMVPALVLVIYVLRGYRLFHRGLGLLTSGIALVGLVWSAFLLDKILIELSPHWSQKHVLASYYAQRASADEPLIAWQLYWRGENFYTKNAIYSSANPNERTVFLGDRNAEKMQQYFASHGGRRVFFVVERTRFESLRQLLPAAARPTLTEVDKTNNKIFLAVATLPAGGAETPAAPKN
jgi:4-amino-4-deoxy-L-arabinose transferase-like glycosyltransferase